MSPEQRAGVAELARLRAEIGEDRQALLRRESDIAEVLGRWSAGPPERVYLVYGAAAVHAWYTGLESLFERIARVLDGGAPRGEQWHRDLVSQAAAEVPGVRPAIVDRVLHADLLCLLAFRHFFRHAYGAELDPLRLEQELHRVRRITSFVHDALSRFDAFLARAESELVK